MALILPFGMHRPRIGRGVFLAPNATVIGDVDLDDEASVWFGAVVRGDIGRIRIGARTNIQDLACVHLTSGVSVTVVGCDVTVGHGAILHGCTVGDRCLVGMGSVILDNAQIGADSLIAAGSVVAPKTVFPPRSLVRGSPARLIREVTADEAAMGIDGARHYVENARRFREICGDLPEVSLARREPRGRIEGEREHEIVPGPERERALDFGNDRDGGED